jgi:hypothetical protein
VENNNLEKIIGFKTELGSQYKYEGNKVIRKKYNGETDEYNLNLFIPSYSQLEQITKSKLKELYSIDNDFKYTEFLSELVYDNNVYISHAFTVGSDNSHLKLINNNKEIEGKNVYFCSLIRKNPNKVCFLVKASKEPIIGYFPYQENYVLNCNKYNYHLGDKVSEVYKQN